MTRFAPADGLRGSVTPPPDKSISHRAALFGAMADEPVTVRNYLWAEDTLSTLSVVQALGAAAEPSGAGDVVIRGVGLRTPAPTTGGHLDVGNAGTLLRMLPGWLAGQPGGVWTLDGDESIRRRPVKRVADPLRLMGAEVEIEDDGTPPMTVRGASLRGIDYELPVPTAQVKSCVLIAGMLASGSTSVSEGSTSRDHTERMLARARVPFERDGLTARVSQVDELELEDVIVPGDPSSAAILATAALVVPGSRVLLEGVAMNWTRNGFLRIAQRMGGVILGDLETPETASPDSEPVGDLDVTAAPLEATEVTPDEAPLAIDELPLVGLLGAFAEGETVVRGAQELRVKESDRIAAVVEGLGGLGADIEATDEGFVVRGPTGIDGGVIDARGDHRIAMLGAIAGLASREGVEVRGMEVAGVSYPGFVKDLGKLAG